MNAKMILRILFFTVFMLSMPARSIAQDDEGWPRVTEAEIAKRFYKESYSFELNLPIFAADNSNQIYNLACIGGEDQYLDNLSDTTGINFVGPLSCQLGIGTEFNGRTLLSEDASPIWHSRGQFHYNQLLGACSTYPEYGRIRNFRLRGMAITFTIEDLQETNGEISTFLLTIKVQNDPNALTAKAERTGYLPPRFNDDGVRACDLVLEGKEPLMCRNSETLSWEECSKGWEYKKYPWESEAKQ